MPRKRVRVDRGGDTDKHSELTETLGKVNKRYGEGSVRMAKKIIQPDRISTGVFILDLALLGGIPHNRCSMFVGERHSGKSTLANKVIASAQTSMPDQTPIILDVEGTFESVWAEQLGVDIDTLPVVPCESGEMAVDVGDAVLGSKETSLLVVDSIAALTPMKEQDASAEDAFVGLQARLVGNFVRRITSSLIRERKRGHYVTVLFLNQFRAAIGGYGPNPRSIPGGKALEYATTVQAIIKNKEVKGKDEEGVDAVGVNEHSFTVTKNKLNNGPRAGDFDLVRTSDHSSGLPIGSVDDAHTVLAYAKKLGYYTGGGTRWTLDCADHKLNFGKAKEAEAALIEDVDLYWDVRTEIIRSQASKLGMPSEFIERIV